MKRIAVFTMILLLAAGIAYAKVYEVKKKTGDYDVVLKFQKAAVFVGDNPVSVEILGTSGHPVADAKVELYYFMPSMPSMNYTEAAKLEGNQYKATVKPTMAGDWDLDLKFSRPGEKVRKVTFTLNVK
jgi:YtkA-like